MSDMNTRWQSGFLKRLEDLRGDWVKRFESTIAECMEPAFDELSAFVSKHGFRGSAPLRQSDRRSFKFELAENAYVLVTFRHEGIDDMVAMCEYFVPGSQPGSYETRVACGDVNREWACLQFQDALDAFVSAFSTARRAEKPLDLELAAV